MCSEQLPIFDRMSSIFISQVQIKVTLKDFDVLCLIAIYVNKSESRKGQWSYFM